MSFHHTDTPVQLLQVNVEHLLSSEIISKPTKVTVYLLDLCVSCM